MTPLGRADTRRSSRTRKVTAAERDQEQRRRGHLLDARQQFVANMDRMFRLEKQKDGRVVRVQVETNTLDRQHRRFLKVGESA